MEGFKLDCAFCDEILQTATIEAVKDQGETHLEDHHESKLVDAFTDMCGGTECRNGCGYVFPVDGSDVAGYDCPECGHDHCPAFIQQYIFWRIETG